jgi:hypothetical protein
VLDPNRTAAGMAFGRSKTLLSTDRPLSELSVTLRPIFDGFCPGCFSVGTIFSSLCS